MGDEHDSRGLLLGRERELQLLDDWWTTPRGPVVVFGYGGLGKTALAREFLRTHSGLFVDVSAATSVLDVLAAIGEMLSFRGGEMATISSVRFAILQKEIPLLVIDNVEQLGASLGELEKLVGIAPRLLFTSRVRVKLPNVVEVALGPLDVAPDRHSASIRLLARRSSRTGLGEADGIDDVTLGYLARIAEITDGIPLALEIAASKVSTFGAEWTVERLERNVLDLQRRFVGKPVRQRTLEEAVAWAWELLDESERRALSWLSLFSSTFGASEAKDLLRGYDPDVERTLEKLTGDHLIAHTPGMEWAYRVLVPIREFARRKLEGTELEQGFEAFSSVILDRAQEQVSLFSRMRTRKAPIILAHWQADLVQVARPPSPLPSHPENMFHAFEALQRLDLTGLAQSPYGRLVLENASQVAFDELSPSHQTAWLVSRALYERTYGTLRSGIELARSALDRAQTDEERGLALTALSSICCSNREFEEAYSLAVEALELSRDMGDKHFEAEAAMALAYAAHFLRYSEEALSVVEAGVAVAREIQASWSLVRYPVLHGIILCDSNDLDAAERVLREGIQEFQTAKVSAPMYLALMEVLVLKGFPEEARAMYDLGLPIAVGTESQLLIGNYHREKAVLELVRQNIDGVETELKRAIECHPAMAEGWDTRALEAVVEFHRHGAKRARDIAASIRTLDGSDASRSLARTILLAYELAVYAKDRDDESGAAVRATLTAIFEPNNRGATWYSDSAKVRIAFSASVQRLKALRFEIPSTKRESVILQMSFDDPRGRVQLGSLVVENLPTAPARILAALAKGETKSITVADAFEIAWPGQSATTKSARNRVHVAMNFLRKNLLGDLLVRNEEGSYLLASSVVVVRPAVSTPPS